MLSIYDAIGGHEALQAAVHRFYERVTADPLLADFFKGIDMRKLRTHQIAFLAQAIDGPARYSGAGMQRAHAHLRIEQRHFDAVAHHLIETLREFSVAESVIDSIVERITPLATQVVNTPSPAASQMGQSAAGEGFAECPA